VQPHSRLGAVNAAIVAVYFTLVWGADALRFLRSPFHGFEERVHATAAAYFRALFDCGLDGLIRISNALATIKFLVAAGFLAYLIEFLRASATGRAPNQETLDYVLLGAVSALMLWAWPALRSGEPDLIRLLATEFLLLIGALIVIYIERQFVAEESAAPVHAAVEPVPLAL
jgi:phage shock protein PspC (stress-responsive transcriptional regulator)